MKQWEVETGYKYLNISSHDYMCMAYSDRKKNQQRHSSPCTLLPSIQVNLSPDWKVKELRTCTRRDMSERGNVLAQKEKGPAVACTLNRVFWFGSLHGSTKSSVPPRSVDYWQNLKSVKENTLIWPSACCFKTLSRRNTHSSDSSIFCKSGKHGAFPKRIDSLLPLPILL